MKRDILDDYQDFLQKVRHKVFFTLTPKRAFPDEDGVIVQELLIKAIVPEVGVCHGAGVVWVNRETFPHGDYSENRGSELIFDPVPPEDEIQTEEDLIRYLFGDNPLMGHDPAKEMEEPDGFSRQTG